MIKISGKYFHGAFLAACCFVAYRLYHQKSQSQLKLIEERKSIQSVLLEYAHEFSQSQIMQKMIPRVFKSERDLQKLTSNLYYRKSSSDLNSLTKSLSEPIWDLLDRGGKRWRPVLCMLIAELYGHNKEEVYDIAALCQIIHNGTLICDDIEDSSTVRRNKPCVHLIYGVDISLNAGNFMYYAPLLYLINSGKYAPPDIVKIGQIYSEEMVNLHIGQGWDILWHNIDKLENVFPTENDYLQMTAHKTGVLARLSARLTCMYLKLSVEQTQTLSKYAETMGVAFQIQDDLLNLEGQEFKKTKGYNGEDIHQGKMSLMVLHTLQTASQTKKDRLIEILKKKTENQDQITEAIAILRDNGSLDYAKKKMNELIQESWAKIERSLPDNPTRTLLRQLSEFQIKRSK